MVLTLCENLCQVLTEKEKPYSKKNMDSAEQLDQIGQEDDSADNCRKD